MFTYIKSKLFFAKLRIEIYKAFEHSEDYICMFTKLASASKDMTPDEVKKEFLNVLAGVIHDSVHNDNPESENK